MYVVFGIIAFLLVMVGHFFRLIRWENFVKIYERPSGAVLLRAMSIGYLLNFFLPFRIGELARAVYAGRRLKSGTGFAIATIIMDRVLDVFAVAVVFICLHFSGFSGDVIRRSAAVYAVFSVVLLLLLWFVGVFSARIKRAALMIGGIFNDRIKLSLLRFFWAVINTFRDVWQIGMKKIAGLTFVMWLCYILSYFSFSAFLSSLGGTLGFTELFSLLFSGPNLGWEALSSAGKPGDITGLQAAMISLYMLAPVFVMYAVTLLPAGGRSRLNTIFHIHQEDDYGDFLHLLPQVEEKDQLEFLDKYFSSENRENLKKYIELNRGVSVLADYSAGSNATTILCMNDDQTFWRKYAFGEEADRLKEQLVWLKDIGSRGDVPLCRITGESMGEGYCCYDMEYDSRTVSMFRYIHTHPLEDSKRILESVLGTLEQGLYGKDHSDAPREVIDEYIHRKSDRNLALLRQSRLKGLLEYRDIYINGKKYRNLPALLEMFEPEVLHRVFAGDTVDTIHGDLTIENIVCYGSGKDTSHAEGGNESAKSDAEYYLIDPNTGNILDSRLLDYGKLLQSLHGGYEFMMMTRSVNLKGNRIDFAFTLSSAYKELYSYFTGCLEKRFGPDQIKSIYHHELLHWLRLMPYKLSKDADRSPMFYAGFIMVANDVYDRYYTKE